MLSYIIYGVYNLLLQVATIGCLFYANTYLNEFIITDRLRWNKWELKVDLTSLAFAHASVLIIEAAFLLLIIYFVNKWYLSRFIGSIDPVKIALFTTGVYAFFTSVLIVVSTYLNFK